MEIKRVLVFSNRQGELNTLPEDVVEKAVKLGPKTTMVVQKANDIDLEPVKFFARDAVWVELTTGFVREVT